MRDADIQKKIHTQTYIKPQSCPRMESNHLCLLTTQLHLPLYDTGTLNTKKLGQRRFELRLSTYKIDILTAGRLAPTAGGVGPPQADFKSACLPSNAVNT